MQVPAEITFKNYTPSTAVRAEIAKQIDKLKKYSSRITSCRIVLNAPQNRQREGGLFKLDIAIAMPQHKDIIVNKSHSEVAEHEHVLVAIKDAFDIARRQVKEAMDTMRLETKTHDTEQHGHVTKFLADAGFIETADGREIYFHKNSVLNDAFSNLRIGAEVRFVEADGDKGAQASTVRVIGKHHLV